MKYIDICIACYDYQAQTEEELSFDADNILYILENSDPDWYKAQLKPHNTNEEGPIGLIPSNYIKKIKHMGHAKALYDYTAQSAAEVSLKEDEILKLYKSDDENWYIVESIQGHIGLAPSNYLQEIAEPTTPVAKSKVDEIPSSNPPTLNSNHKEGDMALSWPVYEYDTKKKKKLKSKGNLLVGNGLLCYGSETNKSSPVRQFPIQQVESASLTDVKVIHIDLQGNESLDFQLASHSEAKAVISKIEASQKLLHPSPSLRPESKPLPAMNSPVEKPLPLTTPPPQRNEDDKKCAIALYAFKPETEGETYLEQNERILLVKSNADDDWWTVEHKDGTVGIVPANYVQLQEEYEAQKEEENKKKEEMRKQQEKIRQEEKAKRKQQEEKERSLKEEEQQKLMTEMNRKKEQRQTESSQRRGVARSEIQSMGPSSPIRQGPLPQAPIFREHEYANKPDFTKVVRIWTDCTGAFKVEAQFISCDNSMVTLQKLNGDQVDVPISKMSKEDVRYIERETGMKLLNDTTPFSWQDYFKKTIPTLSHDTCVEYANTFEANNLSERDIDKLTPEQMNMLGMANDHVQQILRARNPDFSSTPHSTFVNQADEDKNFEQIISQIEQDEKLARELQEQEERQHYSNNNSREDLQRRDNGHFSPHQTTNSPSPPSSMHTSPPMANRWDTLPPASPVVPSQQINMDPHYLARWGGSPALAEANLRPVPAPPTTFFTPPPQNQSSSPFYFLPQQQSPPPAYNDRSN